MMPSSWPTLALVSALLVSSGCGLFLDTSPPDGEEDDGGVVTCEPAECGDDIECTVDECGDGGCVHRPDDSKCSGEDICVVGYGCSNPTPCASDADCRGLVLGSCVVASCVTDIGYCEQHKDVSLCDDDVGCTADVCADDGTCSSSASDALCDDGASCTIDGACAPEDPNADSD